MERRYDRTQHDTHCGVWELRLASEDTSDHNIRTSNIFWKLVVQWAISSVYVRVFQNLRIFYRGLSTQLVAVPSQYLYSCVRSLSQRRPFPHTTYYFKLRTIIS